MATFQIKIQQSGRTVMAESVALPAVSSVETSLKQRQQRTTKSNRRQRRRQQTAQQQQQQQQLTAATFDPPTAKNVNESLTSNLLSFNLPSSNGNSNSSSNNNNGNRNGNKSQQDIDTFNLLNGSRQRQRHRSSVAAAAAAAAMATGDARNRLQDSTYAGNSNNTCSSCCCKLNTIKSNSSLNTNSTPLTTFCNARIFRLDAAASLIMLTMLVVVTLVISGNGVLAAQRDVFKAKDNVNANAIQNNGLVDSSAVGASSGFNVNGNMPSNGISSNGNNKNTSIPTGAATSTITSFTSIATSTLKAPSTAIHANGDGNGNGNDNGTLTTSVTMATTSTSTTSSTTTTTTGHSIASSSLQKVSSNSPSGTSGINRNTIELVDDTRNGPYFDKAASKNVTALLGKTAYLNCRVKNLGNKTMLLQVSWVRHRDIHLLTVGRYTYTSDQRFRAIHQPQTEDWILQIKYPQHRDSGVYECQVSTTPHMSHYIHLNVVEPSTEIIGAPDLYIESGSTINLTCVILNSPEPPAYIFWNHNNAIINYDSPRGGVSVVTNKGETTTSFLLIKSARPSDSGLYQCNPSNAKPKSVTVHVLNGEFPAAMQHAAQAHQVMSPSLYLLVYLFVCYCSSVFVSRSLRPPPLGLRQRGAAVATGGMPTNMLAAMQRVSSSVY